MNTETRQKLAVVLRYVADMVEQGKAYAGSVEFTPKYDVLNSVASVHDNNYHTGETNYKFDITVCDDELGKQNLEAATAKLDGLK